MESLNTNQLEEQLDLLVSRYQELRDENKKLRSNQWDLVDERSKLLEKNELATSKIEAMISRLKTMGPKNG
ncbi:MAG: TIGR02449 family protein [Gammaproteobacteria bacterium]|nr:TIGR02449 family protein [Gammaproteobacteria bacterium]